MQFKNRLNDLARKLAQPPKTMQLNWVDPDTGKAWLRLTLTPDGRGGHSVQEQYFDTPPAGEQRRSPVRPACAARQRIRQTRVASLRVVNDRLRGWHAGETGAVWPARCRRYNSRSRVAAARDQQANNREGGEQQEAVAEVAGRALEETKREWREKSA